MSRPGKGEPSGRNRGTDSAAARVTVPRMPAQLVTNTAARLGGFSLARTAGNRKGT